MTADDQQVLARVIPLTPHLHAVGAPAEELDVADADDARPDRSEDILDRRIGDLWIGLPAAAGRAGLRLEQLLKAGPTALDASVSAEIAIKRSPRVVAAARVALGLLAGQAEILGEALGADLSDADLADLHEIAAATVALSTAARPVPAWGSVAGADAAAVVLEVAEPVVRDAARTHDELYTCFTERVWEIPVARLAAGSHRWRLLSRRRLRHALRQVGRSATLPGGLDRAARVVRDAHTSRARLAPLRPLLAHHLGVHDRGPLTDLDGVLASLDAVRDLQRSLGDRQDDERLERLLTADAFRTPEVLRPASLVLRTLTAWAGDLAAAGGSATPLAISAEDLRHWVDGMQRDLPTVAHAWDAYRVVGSAAATLRELIDALVLREHAADLEASAGDSRSAPAEGRCWSAS